MTIFNVLIAKQTIGISALFSSTKDFCKDYLTTNTPDFNVVITAEDIMLERQKNEKQMALEGYSQKDFTDEYIETLALYRKIVEILLEKNILLFHGCVIACDEKAYVFTAKSGTGKTTHANLWLNHIPNCHILNGDKPLFLFENGKAYACGTPWNGKECLGKNEILPIAGICILERDVTNHIERISFSSAFGQIINQSYRSDGSKMLSIIKIVKNLENVPVYLLGCNMDPEAARVSYEGMTLGGNNGN